MSKKRRIVYSTDTGRICPSCGQPAAKCTCRREKPKVQSDGIVRVRRKVKGRRGKTVTTISGIPLKDDELRQLATELKRRCGTGGSVKDGIIVIQGDHRATLIPTLKQHGFKVKRAGG